MSRIFSLFISIGYFTYYIIRKIVQFIALIIYAVGVLFRVIIWYVNLIIRRMVQLRVPSFLLGFIICGLLFGSIEIANFVNALPNPADIGKSNYPVSTHLYDRERRLLYEVYRDEDRSPIPLSMLPHHVVDATVAIEDKDFYKHSGISPVSGILRAIRDSVRNKQLQGGSTITQQLVKLSLLSPERTIVRKIKEAILAMRVERMYDKKKILELYLNQVPYGGNVYGIEEAAEEFYGKKASELTVAEAAMLAGLPQSPSVYSPYVNLKLNIKRRNDVLRAMFEQRYISKKTYESSLKDQTPVLPLRNQIRAPHFVFYAKHELENQFGISQVETGGLTVTTTLDLDVQIEAEKILKEEIAKIKNLNVSNGAILVTRPKTGEILAMVGSVDYFASPSGAFNVVTAARQPGSSIKPIMYSLALTNGYTEASVIDDVPIVYVEKGRDPYRPVNYDGRYHGKVTLRYALANSYNVPAVRVLQNIGVRRFVDYGRLLGIQSWQDSSRYGLALTLGGGEVTMIEMATAMGVFANQGNKAELTSVREARDMTGQRRSLVMNPQEQVVSPAVSYIISDILSDNIARKWAFGSRSALEIDGYKVAVKTGTTDKKKDNWTIGYTPDYLVAVWVGNNDNTPMHKTLTSGITGAAPIWNRVMRFVLEHYQDENKWFTQPDDVVGKKCHYGRTEYFIKGTENNTPCFVIPSSITLPTQPRQ